MEWWVTSIVMINVMFLVFLIRYLWKARVIIKEGKEAGDIISDVVGELRTRLANQDGRIADLQVRMDVLVARLTREKSLKDVNVIGDTARRLEEKELSSLTLKGPVDFGSGDISRQVTSRHNMHDRGVGVRILELLREGPKTAKDIEKSVGRSREHTARVMKKMSEGGLVIRDRSRKPFRYSLAQ